MSSEKEGFQRGDAGKWDGKSTSALEVWVSEQKGKKLQKEKKLFVQNFQENYCFSFQWAVPKRVESLILVLILIKILFICIYNKGITNTVPRTRGALPSARWDNIVYWTVWIQLAWHIILTGFSKHQCGAIKA